MTTSPPADSLQAIAAIWLINMAGNKPGAILKTNSAGRTHTALTTEEKVQRQRASKAVMPARHQAFAEAYVSHRGNVGAAARVVGVSKKKALDWLAKPAVAGLVRQAYARVSSQHFITALDVVAASWEKANDKKTPSKEQLGYMKICAEATGAIGPLKGLDAPEKDRESGVNITITNFADEVKPVVAVQDGEVVATDVAAGGNRLGRLVGGTAMTDAGRELDVVEVKETVEAADVDWSELDGTELA